MRNFFFNQQKQHKILPLPLPAELARQESQTKSIETSIPNQYNRQILTRNMEISQPIFSVSAIFGLKQGSCHSCGH
jgi:hypothetical protein